MFLIFCKLFRCVGLDAVDFACHADGEAALNSSIHNLLLSGTGVCVMCVCVFFFVVFVPPSTRTKGGEHEMLVCDVLDEEGGNKHSLGCQPLPTQRNRYLFCFLVCVVVLNRMPAKPLERFDTQNEHGRRQRRRTNRTDEWPHGAQRARSHGPGRTNGTNGPDERPNGTRTHGRRDGARRAYGAGGTWPWAHGRCDGVVGGREGIVGPWERFAGTWKRWRRWQGWQGWRKVRGKH